MSYNIKLENFLDLQTYKQNKSQKRAALFHWTGATTNVNSKLYSSSSTDNSRCQVSFNEFYQFLKKWLHSWIFTNFKTVCHEFSIYMYGINAVVCK